MLLYAAYELNHRRINGLRFNWNEDTAIPPVLP